MVMLCLWAREGEGMATKHFSFRIFITSGDVRLELGSTIFLTNAGVITGYKDVPKFIDAMIAPKMLQSTAAIPFPSALLIADSFSLTDLWMLRDV